MNGEEAMTADNGSQITATRQRRGRTGRPASPTTNRRARNGASARAAAQAPKEAKPKRGPGRRRTELNAQVVQDLATLRGTLDEMLERYRIRVGGQISELMQLIQGDGNVDQRPRLLTVKAAEVALEAVRETDLKPKKARGKDFVKLQRLVRTLRGLGPNDT